MADFYVAIEGQQQGPYPAHELVARGMTPDSLVWREGMADWQRADTVAELAGVFVAAQQQQQQYAPPVQQQYQPPAGQRVVSAQEFVARHFGPAPGYAAPRPYDPAQSNRIAAGICAMLFGGLGVHKFILGRNGAGLVMLLVTLLTCGIGGFVMWPLGFIEGVIYLTRSDADFYQTYVVERRAWF
jgi:TM2 domain-containing membrane protein YozV